MTVTIRSNVTTAIICCNQSVELTCYANGTVISYKWTSSKSNQSEETTSITVTATDNPVEYTCTVRADSNGDSTGNSSIIISSNSKKLLIVELSLFSDCVAIATIMHAFPHS